MICRFFFFFWFTFSFVVVHLGFFFIHSVPGYYINQKKEPYFIFFLLIRFGHTDKKKINKTKQNVSRLSFHIMQSNKNKKQKQKENPIFRNFLCKYYIHSKKMKKEKKENGIISLDTCQVFFSPLTRIHIHAKILFFYPPPQTSTINTIV